VLERVKRDAGELVIHRPAQAPGNCPSAAMISRAVRCGRTNDLMIVPTLA